MINLILNKIDTDLRRKIHEETSDGKVHSKVEISINKDSEKNREKAFKINKEKNKKNQKDEKIKSEDEATNLNSDFMEGYFLDIRK